MSAQEGNTGRSGTAANFLVCPVLLKNSRHLVFNSGSIPDAVAAQAAPYDL
jgi:hypothetical protein